MIEVKVESESGCSDRPAKVLVFQDGKLVTSVTARIEPQKGADGGFYDCIVLTKDD